MNAALEIAHPDHPAAPARNSLWTRLFSTGAAVRALLFVWTCLIACPIRYWSIHASEDNTWVFAINYAAAHGLATGRDIVWTTGPLGYLIFPQDIGANLVHALVFQGVLWAVLIAIFADLFYFSLVHQRNLAFFTISSACRHRCSGSTTWDRRT